MKIIYNNFINNILFNFIAFVWLFSLFNPIFKKYDYGAGFPVVGLFALLSCFLFFIYIFKKKSPRKKITSHKLSIWHIMRSPFSSNIFKNLKFQKYCKKTFDALPIELISLFSFVFFFSLSFFFSEARDIGLSETFAFISVSIFYFIFAYQKNNWSESFIKLLNFATLASVLVGAMLYLFFDEVRMMGPFLNKLTHSHTWPNAFALFLLMSWPFLLLKKHKWLVAFAISTIFLTYSRGAILVLFGQLMMLLAYFIYIKMRFKALEKIYELNFQFKKIILNLIIISSIILVFFSGMTYLRSLRFDTVDINEKINFEDDEGTTSTNERFVFFNAAMDLALDKPLLGLGPFTFRQAYNANQKKLMEAADHPHNWFLKVAAENGFLTLFSLLMFLLSGAWIILSRFLTISKHLLQFYILEAKKLIKSEENTINLRKLHIIALGFISVAGGIAHNMIDYNLNFMANLILLFWLLALIRSTTISSAKVVPSKATSYKVRSDKIALTKTASMKTARTKITPTKTTHNETTHNETTHNKTTSTKIYKSNVVQFISSTFVIIFIIFTGYEALVNAATVLINDDFLKYSIYPRQHHLNIAKDLMEEDWNYKTGDIDLNNEHIKDYYINDKVYELANKSLTRAMSGNNLDAEIYFTKGLLDCGYGDFTSCEKYFKKALELDPMNNFKYYFYYIELKAGCYSNYKISPGIFSLNDFDSNEIDETKKCNKIDENELKHIESLLEEYFIYVENNVHFTAYTDNVEYAALLIDLIVEIDDSKSYLFESKEKMIYDAEHARSERFL